MGRGEREQSEPKDKGGGSRRTVRRTADDSVRGARGDIRIVEPEAPR